MESSTELNMEPSLPSLEGDCNDIIMLPNKKKNKKEAKQQAYTNIKTKLSKSQKRKLKKIQEEKEKEALLLKSMEILEKYKIEENVHSLMWSSRNMGQVETVKEKRRREVQFSKAGLKLPESDRPFKKKANEDNGHIELRSTSIESQVFGFKDDSQPDLAEQNFPKDTASETEPLHELVPDHGPLNGSRDRDIRSLVTEVVDENTEPEISQRPCSDSSKTTKSMDIEETNLELKCSSSVNNQEDSFPVRGPSVPTVIHVSRPEEVEKTRRDLPIVMMEQEIMEAINENISLIICGETGCGKTTQVPQFLYEAGYGSKKCDVRGGIIGVTQPRRVAVLATAKRVAFELGLCLGKEVGFQVRHDRRIGDNCSIKFMTDGILLREVQNDFLLKRYSVLILDEAHERSLNTDILIGMLSRVIQERQREYESQQKRILSGQTINQEDKIYPLKLVLMSATLRVEDFVSGQRIFKNPPPIIEVPTRQYPVTIHFSKRTEIIDYIGQAYKKVLSIHKSLPPGGILVFVTGQREVEYLCQRLRRASQEIVKNIKKGNEAASEEKTPQQNDVDEISEAFDFEKSSSHDITERFGSYMEDNNEDFSENESDDMSYDSGEESDLEFYDDEEKQSKQTSLQDPANVLGEESFASLKAAFEALAGNNKASDADPEVKDDSTTTAVEESGQAGRKMREEKDNQTGPMRVLPLYAMLPAPAQLRVFEQIKEGERLVVVATNVAETSLTIPGIKYVVDTGREKVKYYNPANGMESYDINWISKASAAQRAGRAGRTGPGHCYRLYSSAVFSNIFPDFSTAEISKVPVDGVVLLMKSMNIGKVANFPFPTPPEASALNEAEHCLKVLEALDNKGRLTPLGKAMARYPMSPRHSRMLLTVIKIMQKYKDSHSRANLVLSYAVASAAALSLSNPFIMQFEGTDEEKPDSPETGKKVDKEEKARNKKLRELSKVSRAKFSNPTSDALTIAFALQCFEQAGNLVGFCTDNTLHYKTMEEMSKLRKQLLQLVFALNITSDTEQQFSWPHGNMADVESAWKISSDKHPLRLNEEEILGQAICAGWADRVARRVKGSSGKLSEGERVNATRYETCTLNEIVLLHRKSSASKSPPDFLVYSELLHTKRLYIYGATGVKPNWLVEHARSLCTFSAPLSDPKPYYDCLADQVFSWVSPSFGKHSWQLPHHPLPIKDSSDRVAVFACALLEGKVLPCMKSVRDFMATSPAIVLKPEAKGLKRVGNLLGKLNSRGRVVDSCAMLRKLWSDDSRWLFLEIKDWFQESFHPQFEGLWVEMQRDVLLDPEERFSKKSKRGKRRG